MLTKEIVRMMLKDLAEEQHNLTVKRDKYKDMNLDHWIVADLNRAIDTLDASIEQLFHDLTQFECDDDEEL